MIDSHNDNYSIVPYHTATFTRTMNRASTDTTTSNQPRLLLVQESQGWTLPRHNADYEAEINSIMREQLGLTTTVLYIAYDRYKGDDDDERKEQHVVYALENHSPNVEPHVGQWMSSEEVAALDLLVPEHRPVIEAWFDEMERGTSERRLPWMQIGWFDGAISWIREQASLRDYTITGEIEQVKVRIWSAVMRVPTDKGIVYFKAVPTYFAYEPPLTQLLSSFVPAHTPPVLTIDAQRLWMLMGDAGTVMRDERDPAHWEEMLALYAQVQMDLIAHVPTLAASGCPDRRLSKLPRLYEELLADTQHLLLDNPKGMPSGEYKQLLAMTSQVKEMCEKLASYNIPETLHHDDLHGGNVLWNGQTYIFFDWSDCALTHPFLSMFIVLRVARYVLEFDEETRQRLITAYLTPWTRYAPIERLREAFSIAHRLGALSRSLTWYLIIQGLDPSMCEEYKDSIPYFLRVFLGTEA